MALGIGSMSAISLRALACLLAVGLATGSRLAAVACSGCDDIYIVPQYRISVVDGASGAVICDATVYQLGEGGAQQNGCEYLTPIPTNVDAVTITVERAGYMTATQQLSTKFDTDRCDHAKPVFVEVHMQKTS